MVGGHVFVWLFSTIDSVGSSVRRQRVSGREAQTIATTSSRHSWLGREGRYCPRGYALDLRSLRPGVDGEETDEGEADGLLDTTSAVRVIEEDMSEIVGGHRQSRESLEAVHRRSLRETLHRYKWDLDAPPTAPDSCRHTSCEYGDMGRRYSDWKRNKKPDDNDRACHETRMLMDIVFHGLCFDQLNAGSLAVFELAC